MVNCGLQPKLLTTLSATCLELYSFWTSTVHVAPIVFAKFILDWERSDTNGNLKVNNSKFQLQELYFGTFP